MRCILGSFCSLLILEEFSFEQSVFVGHAASLGHASGIPASPSDKEEDDVKANTGSSLLCLQSKRRRRL